MFEFLSILGTVDARPYAEVIKRMSHLFHFASLLPVIADLRFSGRAMRPPRSRPEEHSDDADSSPTAGVAKEEDSESQQHQPLPLGFLSAALLAASQLCLCSELFQAPVKKKVAAHPIPKFVEKVEEASKLYLYKGGRKKKQKVFGSGKGFMDNVLAFIATVLESETNFTTAHSIVLLATLVVLVTHLLQAHVLKRNAKHAVFFVLNAVAFFGVAAGFIMGHRDLLKKAGKAIVSEQLFSVMWLPLRALALIAAERPRENEANVVIGGTPGLFAGLQVASMIALLAAELVTGNQDVGVSTQKFLHSMDPKILPDSPMLAVLAPVAISVIWLVLTHLYTSAGGLFMCMFCSVISSPAFLTLAWPKLETMIGFSAKNQGTVALTDMLSIIYALLSVLSMVFGGTLSFVGIFVLSHALIGIHGLEGLGLGALGAA
jgi:hypothetical protein